MDSFLTSFASMLILGAGRDGERVAKHIVSRASHPARDQQGGRARASAGQEVAA